MYRQTKSYNPVTQLYELSNAIVRTVDNAFIPFDTANTDYQEYLKWVAEGNTPQPAE